MIKKLQNAELFVFEGPDGSGKTTLSLAFSEYLRSEGLECEYFAFPGHESGTLGKLVYDLHHDSRTAGVESITPTSLQLLHIAAHVDAIQARILPTLKAGKTAVLDRFWWSTWAYGKVSGVSTRALKAMIDVEKTAWDKVHPTKIFLIRRMTSLDSDGTHEFGRLSTEYMKLATREARHHSVQYIENERTVAETLKEIVRGVGVNDQIHLSNGPITNDHLCKHQNQLPLTPNKTSGVAPIVFTRLAPAEPTVVFDTYWRFAAERQAIFFRRLAGKPQPWTKDPVLMQYKFTNAYRASDRVSQYLIRHVIYEGDQSPEELFFRILLFKFFNKIETWELLTSNLGRISFADYSFERYDSILTRAIEGSKRIYSAAYIMPSGGPSAVSARKHHVHLKLLEQMIRDELPARLVDIPSMKKAFELLRSYQTIGDFLAYQFVTDLNYSPLMNFSEMDFVVPGPGARDGIRKCFRDLGGLNESEIIRVVTDRQQAEFERQGLAFQSLWGRPLQLIDCQNLFCEVDKYARIHHPEIVGITGRTRIKQRYRSNPDTISVWYPPKWGLNERIVSEGIYVSSI
jgi:thymidylate kinase